MRDTKKLERYREMRTPEATTEPFGYDSVVPAAPAEVGAFVVHLHDATRRHYDVRLEAGGELLSFAVPHGPSLDPSKKHLAMRTEDHPIEYLEFEDVIPEGEYGGGPMIAWDRGSVTYLEGPPEDELAQGKLHVELRGMKLRGRWAFVKLAKSGRGDKGNEWLFFKKADESASTERDIVSELPRSVLSGLTVEELLTRDERGKALEDRALAMGAQPARGPFKLAPIEGAVRSVLPAEPGGSVVPSSRGRKARSRPPPEPSELLYDVELGGVRVLALRDGDVVTLKRPRGDAEEDLSGFYPDVVRALRALPPSRVALEGELVAFDASGRPSRAQLVQRAQRFGREGPLRATTAIPVTLVATDVLCINSADTTALPIEDRRSLLDALLPSVGFLRAATPLRGEPTPILETCAGLGIAGVVAKPAASTYGDGWRRVETGLPPASIAPIPHQAMVRNATVTNREKLFWPEDGFTKGDLIDYYAAVADVLVPFLKNRPIILVRYPDGVAGKSFYQWNVPAGMPAWVRTLKIKGDTLEPDHFLDAKSPKRGFLVEDPATLVYIANLGCIPLHVLASRQPNLHEADFFTIDFDVKQSELRHAITLARTLHGILDDIGLPSFPKTSGQSGLHVLVPLGPGQTFETACALCDLLGRLIVERHPDLATMERRVDRRGDRVYVDTGQTGTSRAIVAPYSVRAVPGARVSTPLEWTEVTPKLDPTRFTIRSVPERLAKKGDLLKGLLEATPDIPAAVAALARRLTPH